MDWIFIPARIALRFHGQVDATAATLRARDRTLASLFRQHDANADGVLDLGEFAALLTAVDPRRYPAPKRAGDDDAGEGEGCGEEHREVSRHVLLFYRQALDVQRRLFPARPRADDSSAASDDGEEEEVHAYNEDEEDDALSPMAFILAARSMLH